MTTIEHTGSWGKLPKGATVDIGVTDRPKPEQKQLELMNQVSDFKSQSKWCAV